MYLYVDVSALAHAIAHSLDEKEVAMGPVHVAVGVASQVSQFVRHYRSTRTYFCFDSPKGSWRKAVSPVYKANRVNMYADDPKRKQRREIADKALTEFLPTLVDLLECPQFRFDFCEADDCAAAVVALNEDKPGLIVTTDKDYWQLITPQVSFLNPIHSYKVQLSEHGTIMQMNADGTQEDWGVTPSQWQLVKALMGDPSDNLAGLCGCGEKTALDVVREGRTEGYLAEQTGMVTPRKSKKNPSPIPTQQDARAIVTSNLSLMSLRHSQVHAKIKGAMHQIESTAVRDRRTNLTKLTLWLETHGITNVEVARVLASAFTDQWTI